MMEIQNLSISQLQNEEAFGFFTLVKEEMDNLPADPGDAAYATFIDHMNALVDRQKAILKGRTTRNKKKAQ